MDLHGFILIYIEFWSIWANGLLKFSVFVYICVDVFLLYHMFCLLLYVFLHFLLCLGQSATGKMTVLTVGSYHDFGEKHDFLGETLLKKESRQISHFPIVCIIDLFHHKWEIQTRLSWFCFSSPPGRVYGQIYQVGRLHLRYTYSPQGRRVPFWG